MPVHNPRRLRAHSTRRFPPSNCRTMRLRPAPRAERIAISRCRSRMRASIRFAMLPQAISNTSDDGAENDEQCRPRVTEQGCNRRSCAGRIMAGISIRVLLREIRGNCLQVLVDLFDGDARLHASKDVKKMRAATHRVRFWIGWIVINRKRGPEVISRRIDWESGTTAA
mgnify:CR=1 FL=1